ncbi:isochorismatase family protein [Massilia sp. PAMC28688]|uniref:isochorismatase family protein n=1 Tax=Massilia sp. PAMC28688 TaxID=2861283 RepID=UPI001C631E56|nr:isochorismatase family protein [Massilia sp. PAMC28688]QYF92732.1 isochorismatase family protein [Massilia sp. PAMC28688]
MKRNLHLLIIDPQNDFCDLPPAYLPAGESPALPVPGAHADMQRVARLIDQGASGLAAISITLDSHHRIDVAHTTFWMDAAGAAVAPFTQITLADLEQGRYAPRDAAARPRVLDYLAALERAGRYQLMVWPTHCEIGSWGHNVHADVRTAYNRWEEATLRTVQKVSKGTNPWTEHYSAIQAEVPDAGDASTQVNSAFIAELRKADRVYITGEAGSHCVKATTEHIVEHWDQNQLERLVLVIDCMSPVSGFGEQHDSFVRAMRERGVTLAQASDVAAELLDNAP